MPSPHLMSAQIEGPLLASRPQLEQDLLQHIFEVRPQLFTAHPIAYLRRLVKNTLDIAATFGLNDVGALRVFLQLRFDIAPGFYKEPELAKVLADRRLPPKKRWTRLSQSEFGDAWLRARAFRGEDEWLARYWKEQSAQIGTTKRRSASN